MSHLHQSQPQSSIGLPIWKAPCRQNHTCRVPSVATQHTPLKGLDLQSDSGKCRQGGGAILPTTKPQGSTNHPIRHPKLNALEQNKAYLCASHTQGCSHAGTATHTIKPARSPTHSTPHADTHHHACRTSDNCCRENITLNTVSMAAAALNHSLDNHTAPQ
jgi:hypothetical protein